MWHPNERGPAQLPVLIHQKNNQRKPYSYCLPNPLLTQRCHGPHTQPKLPPVSLLPCQQNHWCCRVVTAQAAPTQLSSALARALPGTASRSFSHTPTVSTPLMGVGQPHICRWPCVGGSPHPSAGIISPQLFSPKTLIPSLTHTTREPIREARGSAFRIQIHLFSWLHCPSQQWLTGSSPPCPFLPLFFSQPYWAVHASIEALYIWLP